MRERVRVRTDGFKAPPGTKTASPTAPSPEIAGIRHCIL
jgi:hypothetical protein